MFVRNCSIGTAMFAALAFGGLVRADVSPDISPDISIVPRDMNVQQLDDMAPMASSAPTATAAPTTPDSALNSQLDKIPGFAATGLSLSGYVEGSLTYSAHPPAGNILADRSFDTKTESIQFDAVNLLFARKIDTTSPFDVGFVLEQYYGWDAAYLHSNGLTTVSNGSQAGRFVGPGTGSTATIHPKAQYDLSQASVSLSFGKVGNGLIVTGGKFLSPAGYELINAQANDTATVASKDPGTGSGLYSHSYIFQEEPFSLTGLVGTYNLLDPTSLQQVSFTGGISRGWDQSTEDDNGDIDFVGKLKYTYSHKLLLALTGITGNEQPSGSLGISPITALPSTAQDGWRTLLDFVGSYAYSDQLFLGVNGMFAWQAQDKNVLDGINGLGYGGTGVWYGAAVYAKYAPSQYVTFNARLEWFDDQNGGAPYQLTSSPANVYASNQFYEVTIGCAIKPFPNDKILSGFTIRPEGRWDYSDHAAFNGGAQHDQWTAAVEAYFAF